LPGAIRSGGRRRLTPTGCKSYDEQEGSNEMKTNISHKGYPLQRASIEISTADRGIYQKLDKTSSYFVAMGILVEKGRVDN
jgi:hypothetical protein